MGDAAVYDLATVVAERDALRKDFDAALAECKLLTHKVITCGVAASHPDASLAHTGAYKEKWDSPQAEEVRNLRAERDALKAEVALRKSEVELFRDKLKARCDEVAKLKAACAAKDAALLQAQIDLRLIGDDYPGSSCHQWCHSRADAITAARSDTAGTNWVDATGAVETVVQEHDEGGVVAYGVIAPVPDAWAGASVKIVRVKP